MKLKLGGLKITAVIRKIVFFWLLISVFSLAACSIPNLEAPECTAARQTVKELYSDHFGNDLQFKPEDLKREEKFLSAGFTQRLQKSPLQTDPFTLTDDPPKAFRVGGCEVAEAGKKVNLQIVFFWRTDTRSEQKEIQVEAINENNNWLVNNIFTKN